MISETAGRCLSLIKALEVAQHRRPDGPAGTQWDQTIRELCYCVIMMDEKGEQGMLDLLLAGLTDEWFCHLGEEAALAMRLATRELLEA